MCRYQLFAEKISNDNGEYETFGILISEETGGDCTEVLRIHDVSTDRPVVERLVKACNSLQLAPCHIYDVIEDILYS